MQQHTLRPHAGSRKTKKRLGRGDGSGHGSFSGRGVKGQNSRTGGGVASFFEGGQTPLTRRIPKLRGFTSPRKKVHQIINLSDLNNFEENTTVDLTMLHEKGLVKRKNIPVKLLGGGELNKKISLKTDAYSKSAKEKLEKAGGKILTTV